MSRRGNAAAVRDDKYLHASVSQVKTFLRCSRLWYADKVLGLKAKQHPGAERGTRLHKQPEAYYLHGTDPTHEAFLSALPGLPRRDSRLLVEHSLENPTLYVGETRLVGFSDLVVPPECSPDGIPEIRDWKFTSSFRYMEDPSNDLQMLIYGYWASKMWPAAREIKLGLHYLLADGSDFKHRIVTVPVERCESEWEEVFSVTVNRMQEFIKLGYEEQWTLEQIPDNRGEACYQYGLCFLADQCGVVPRGKADREVCSVLGAFDSGLT